MEARKISHELMNLKISESDNESILEPTTSQPTEERCSTPDMESGEANISISNDNLDLSIIERGNGNENLDVSMEDECEVDEAKGSSRDSDDYSDNYICNGSHSRLDSDDCNDCDEGVDSDDNSVCDNCAALNNAYIQYDDHIYYRDLRNDIYYDHNIHYNNEDVEELVHTNSFEVHDSELEEC
ncbi:unnamed protein product [Hermetia illucens]|uniref:Uncharacterized protein n=1 Tax=Hermetia illucens TaxID=343691 RepID=A0A7R8UZ47_HERIL|nr:unnamed protein product [Hermetia illucens]